MAVIGDDVVIPGLWEVTVAVVLPYWSPETGDVNAGVIIPVDTILN